MLQCPEVGQLLVCVSCHAKRSLSGKVNWASHWFMHGGGRLQTGCAEDIQEDLAPHLLTDVPCCTVIQPHHTCVLTVKEQMLVEVRCVSRCFTIFI